MNWVWRMGTAIRSAMLGWATLLVICSAFSVAGFIWTVVQKGYRSPYGFDRSVLFVFFVWIVCTFLVTVIVTTIFVAPYFAFTSNEALLRRPWRVFLEPALILAFLYMALCLRPFDSLVRNLNSYKAFGLYAFATSLISSAFYLRDLRRLQRNYRPGFKPS